VGEDNSRLYVEQENRMKVLLEYISQGEYIEKAKKRVPDAITDYIEPSEEYGMLKSEMQKWKDGELSENQIRQLIENIVNFSIGCKEFYGNILMQEGEEEQTIPKSTLQISSQMVQFSNSVIEKYNEIYDATSSKDIYSNILEIFESGTQEIENTILIAETQHAYEDVVANILDNPNFNAACKIETAYFSYELDRAAKILESFEGRAELADTVEKCKKLRNVIKSREEAYMTIEELVAGKSRPTLKVDIKDENEGR
jgi:hypothetical protein